MTASAGIAVREFYARIGITLLRSSGNEAPARCFANPDAHRRHDRHPSVSVNIVSGAFFCHGCAARGGAYDAALLQGHTPRSAMELLIEHGLAQPRRPPAPRRRRSSTDRDRVTAAASVATTRAKLTVTDEDIASWSQRLLRNDRLVHVLRDERAISRDTLARFAIGYDGARITIPTRNATGHLVGVVRWQPLRPGNAPKMLALPGSARDLFPAPETLAAGPILLCEGEPDALAAHTAGLPAVAIPGAASWRRGWAQRFVGRDVTIALDCDHDGRDAAQAAAIDLRTIGLNITIVDLDPARRDGYDITNHLRARRALAFP